MVLTLQKRLIHLSKTKAKHLTVPNVPNYVNIFFKCLNKRLMCYIFILFTISGSMLNVL